MSYDGPYTFKLFPKAIDGFVEEELQIAPGEWAWHRKDVGGVPFLAIYCCCPDCGLLMTIWRRFGTSDVKGHQIDGAGNVSPSVLHSYKESGVEKCGFHSIPTKLEGFVDKR